jgi:acyl carrier protein
LENRQEKTAATPSREAAARLLEIISQLLAEIHPGRTDQSTPLLDSSLDRDLGLDSLSRVELLARIEQTFNISLPEQLLVTVDTVRDLLRAILGASAARADALTREAAALTLDRVDDTPLAAETLVEVVEWHVRNHPDRPHIRFYSDEERDDSITYRQLWDNGTLVAAGLQHYGLHPGESVLIMLPTGREYFFAFFGILLAGGIPVPVYPPGRLKQIEEHLLRHAAIADNSLARIMITVTEAKRFARLMHTRAVNLRHVLTLADLSRAGDGTLPDFKRPALTRENIAFLQYTSGSTGLPKGVVLTHANLLANIRVMARVLNVTSDDVFISWLPLYHDMGLIGAWLGSLHFACQLVIMPPLAFIAKPHRWLWAIHRYRGTLSAAPNFAYELCLRRIDDRQIEGLDLSSWRVACNGAEAVNPQTIRNFMKRFSPYGFRPQAMLPVYGLAESSVGLTFPRPGSTVTIDRIRRDGLMDSGKAIPASDPGLNALEFVCCGEPLPGHQVRIVDKTGRELPERMEGSLQFKGPSATSGYFKNPAKTRDLFHGDWLDSGDKAYMAEGSIYITGRSKDIIIRAGRNIYPEEMEEAIGKIEGIRAGNVAAFGSRSEDATTERLVILAETRKKEPQALEQLRRDINGVVTDLTGSPPDTVVLAPPNTVLKTSSGKIRRNASREIYESGRIGKAPHPLWLQLARFILQGVRTRWQSGLVQLRATLFAAWSWFLYCGLAPVVAFLVAILPGENLRWTVMRLGGRVLAGLTGTKIRLHGPENLPGPDFPCILVANHASYLDGYVLAAVTRHPFSFIAKAELRQKPLVGFLLKRIGTLFVERFDRQQGVADARMLADKGKSGRSLLFFPEGTFMRMPGLLPFKMGAFETAVRLGIPIVPIAIRGTRSILRADSWFPRRGAIVVTIGKPIHPGTDPGGGEKDSWAATLLLRDKTRQWLLNHCGEPDLIHEQPHLKPSGPTLTP